VQVGDLQPGRRGNVYHMLITTRGGGTHISRLHAIRNRYTGAKYQCCIFIKKIGEIFILLFYALYLKR
jgi:hypothetical protein